MKNDLTPLELREIADEHYDHFQAYYRITEIILCIGFGLCGGATFHKLLADHYTNKWLKSVGAKSKN
jgi:hypothetical protein